MIGMDDVAHHKPAPDGLLRILTRQPRPQGLLHRRHRRRRRAAPAPPSVPFIGIAAPSNPRYLDLVFLFQEEGAYAIVDDINYLDEVFAA